jgi:hypothetical protein
MELIDNIDTYVRNNVSIALINMQFEKGIINFELPASKISEFINNYAYTDERIKVVSHGKDIIMDDELSAKIDSELKNIKPRGRPSKKISDPRLRYLKKLGLIDFFSPRISFGVASLKHPEKINMIRLFLNGAIQYLLSKKNIEDMNIANFDLSDIEECANYVKNYLNDLPITNEFSVRKDPTKQMELDLSTRNEQLFNTKMSFKLNPNIILSHEILCELMKSEN